LSGLPAADLQAAVRAAEGNAGRPQALSDRDDVRTTESRERGAMMNYAVPTKSPSNRAHCAAVALLAMAALCPQQALAQMPARFYWKPLSGSSAVPLIVNSFSGNSNPIDPAYTVTPGAQFDATMAQAGYAHVFSLFDRSAMAAVILPMGRVSGDVTVAGKTFNQS